MRELAMRHPYLIGAVFAVLAGWSGFCAYRGGMAVGEMREASGDAARLASEALGG